MPAQAQPYNGRVAFFRAQQSDISLRMTAGWREVCVNHLDVYDILGNHLTMMQKPNVQEMAKKLETVLKELFSEKKQKEND